MPLLLLVGAALLGLPIAIHLIMKQEPKRLPFPALRFLKQKQRTNQRKLRLRHFLLLALRILLIGIFCAALFQPKVPSGGLSLAGEQPVAVVLIVDTTPSMGYVANEKTRLDEARRRAIELLDDLPPGSHVAVLDPADPVGVWEQSIGDARRKLEGLREPHGGGPPVTAAILSAYQLLRTIDDESDAAEKPRRLVAIFSDRTAECWKAGSTESLKQAAEQVPPPAVAHLFVDVGVESPVNVGIVAAEVRPQLGTVGRPVTVTATLNATGPDVPSAVVRCKLDDALNADRKELALVAGSPKAVSFEFKDLKPGWHRAELSLEAADRLMFDNVRTVVFRVGEGRTLLTISDDPDDAAFWVLAHRQKGDFAVEVKKPDEVTDFAGYEAVCLLSVADPSRLSAGGRPLWQLLRDYVNRGGKLLIIPGGPEQMNAAAYDPASASGLMPGKFTRVVATDTGATWVTDEKAVRHPLLAPFKEWKLKGTVDFLRSPRKAWKFWHVEAPAEATIVSYDDDPDPAKRSPAVLETVFPSGGKVVLLTTRLDSPWEPERRWSNYWETAESSWNVVFPNLLAKYLAGDAADAAYNFPTGLPVVLALPKSGGKARKFAFRGPGVADRDSKPDITDTQAEFRLPIERTLTAGAYRLETDDGKWAEHFALATPGDESTLTKVPLETLEAALGPNSVVPVDKDVKLSDILASRFDPEIKLFPWLLIAALALFVGEGLLANRFYRRPR